MSVDVSGQPVVLLRSRIWPVVLVPAAVLVGEVAFGIWTRRPPDSMLTILAAVSVVSALAFRGDEVLADDVGLLVRHRGKLTRSYRWDQIGEAGLVPASWFGWSGVTVFPNGGPYDVPGPNSPTVVGKVWLWRIPRQVRHSLVVVLRSHGVTVLDARTRRR